MSILIKGMDMPKNCCGCVFSWYTPTGKTPFCKRTGKDLAADVYFNKRDSDCPLVPVPPHGRLGDLDELHKEAVRRSEKAGTHDIWYNCMDRVISAFDIKNAPTIISADCTKEES